MKTEKMFKKYGQDAVYTVNGNEHFFKAFVQPLRYKNKLYLRGKYTQIGKNREDYYLYIGPPECDITQVDGMGTKLIIGGESYLPYRTEKRCVSEKVIYYWAIIRPVIEDDDSDITEENGEAVG